MIVAAKNLGDNAVGYRQDDLVFFKRRDCERRLLAGEIVNTPLALFQLGSGKAT